MTKNIEGATKVITKRYCEIVVRKIARELFDHPHYITWIDSGNNLPQNAYLWKVVPIPSVIIGIKNCSKGYAVATTSPSDGTATFGLRFENETQGFCCDFAVKLYRKRYGYLEELGGFQMLIQLRSSKARDAKQIVANFDSNNNSYVQEFSPIPSVLASEDEEENKIDTIDILNEPIETKRRKCEAPTSDWTDVPMEDLKLEFSDLFQDVNL